MAKQYHYVVYYNDVDGRWYRGHEDDPYFPSGSVFDEAEGEWMQPMTDQRVLDADMEHWDELGNLLGVRGASE